MAETRSATPARLPIPASIRRVAAMPSVLDMAVICCMAGLAFVFAGAARHTFAALSTVTGNPIHLGIGYLPGYALRTTLRMFAALACSLAFTFTYPVWAAKSRRAGLVLVPILDVLQSVPVLSFLTFTTTFFLGLFPGRVLGAEFACIFAVFTGQAWNMAFSMFQSLKTIPAELQEASSCYRLTSWQRFWRLEVPFAMPGLIWNTLMSMSGGWFFIVACESVTVGATTFTLPGIGSYVAEALHERDAAAILYAVITMGIVILLYDQLLFRPLVAWSAKFRYEMVQRDNPADPWMLALLRRTSLLRRAGDGVGVVLGAIASLPLGGRGSSQSFALPGRGSRVADVAITAVLVVAGAYALFSLGRVVAASLTLHEVGKVLGLGLLTLARVVSMIALAALIWVPLGILIGLRPAWVRLVQPAAQFLAAFPANLFYPLFVIVIVHDRLNPGVWLTPLMVLGTQWYILFNVIAGASAFPGDLLEAARSFRIGSLLWWRRVAIPGVFPYVVTGAITASGGCWNASIVSEMVSWGQTTVTAAGLGAYIAQATSDGATIHVVLGTVVMSGFVLGFNRFFWRPLYAYSSRRLTIA